MPNKMENKMERKIWESLRRKRNVLGGHTKENREEEMNKQVAKSRVADWNEC